jgi:hypothetical protein
MLTISLGSTLFGNPLIEGFDKKDTALVIDFLKKQNITVYAPPKEYANLVPAINKWFVENCSSRFCFAGNIEVMLLKLQGKFDSKGREMWPGIDFPCKIFSFPNKVCLDSVTGNYLTELIESRYRPNGIYPIDNYEVTDTATARIIEEKARIFNSIIPFESGHDVEWVIPIYPQLSGLEEIEQGKFRVTIRTSMGGGYSEIWLLKNGEFLIEKEDRLWIQ